MEWKAVYYNGLETNVEITRCGKVRRIKVDWIKNKSKTGEVDFSNLKLHTNGYKSLGIQIKGLKPKAILLQQLIASVFLGYKFQGHKLVIDHIDSNKLNNHIDNLRVVTQRENISKEKSIKSGLPTGVYFRKDIKKYITQIQINNKRINLGSFNTIEEASNAYQNKLKTLNQ
jgi:hypothetical protein